jgi:hypothetical protein
VEYENVGALAVMVRFSYPIGEIALRSRKSGTEFREGPNGIAEWEVQLGLTCVGWINGLASQWLCLSDS